MSTSNNFGDYLRSLRKKTGMTQNELAKAIGKSSMYISNIESGKNLSPPRQSDLLVMANKLGLEKKERNSFFEVAAANRSTLPQEMIDYILACPSLKDLIWVGYEKSFTDWQWQTLAFLMTRLGLQKR
jgi:transcriptional regulator with XRE-family HTH domain